MIDDTTFELDLRAMLAARDPGPAPAALSGSFRARLDAEPRRRSRAVMGRWGEAAAALAGITAVVVLFVLAGRQIATTPGASLLPVPAAPYTIRPGDGVVAGDYLPLAQLVVGSVVFAGLAQWFVRSTDRRRRIISAAGMLLVVLVGVSIGTSNAVGYVTGISGLEGGRVGPQERPGLFVDAAGDAPFTAYLTVTNTSRLPLEIEGITAPPILEPGMIVNPRFVGVGILPDTSVDLTTAPREPFVPRTLQPDESIDLALLGMAGQCAVIPRDPATTAYTWIDRVGIVYEQLTVRHSAEVILPDPINVSTSETCP
jgi:hypothetical protein